MARRETVAAPVGPAHDHYGMVCVVDGACVPWDEDAATYRCPLCRRRMTLLPVDRPPLALMS